MVKGWFGDGLMISDSSLTFEPDCSFMVRRSTEVVVTMLKNFRRGNTPFLQRVLNKTGELFLGELTYRIIGIAIYLHVLRKHINE